MPDNPQLYSQFAGVISSSLVNLGYSDGRHPWVKPATSTILDGAIPSEHLVS